MTRRLLTAAAWTIATAAFLVGLPAWSLAANAHTSTATWHLPAGVNPHTSPVADWFPQTVTAPAECGWVQR